MATTKKIAAKKTGQNTSPAGTEKEKPTDPRRVTSYRVSKPNLILLKKASAELEIPVNTIIDQALEDWFKGKRFGHFKAGDR